jgi:hypothetical protein
MPFSQEMAKYKEKRILYFDLRIFTAIQICLKYAKITGPYYTHCTHPSTLAPVDFFLFLKLKENLADTFRSKLERAIRTIAI